uniref:Membrane magnesium transporter n=1 Tax=Gossypium raimondii TaxID=29730 RepID=A0A0D2NMI5_GOSRA|nr:hypothetical protein B456_006G061900 [Gossypium raimondii]
MGLGFMVGVLGVLFLFHAAYSTIQCKISGAVEILEEKFSGPPMNLLLGFVFCISAALTVPGYFLSIHPDSEENRIVSLSANLDFMIFNHRAKALPLETDMKLKH